jgi:hypothetical protein
MKNTRSRPKGYFLTILQENDHYFVGKEKGLSTSSRRYLNLGSTIKEIREEMKNVRLLEGEHLWMGYQGENTMPSVIEAWTKIYGKLIQYRAKKRNPYYEGFNCYGVHFESLLPFFGDSSDRYFVEMNMLGYNFTRDVIARRDLAVKTKMLLFSLCECDGKSHDDYRYVIQSNKQKMFGTCEFSYMPDEWEEHVKVSFPFGVVCYKWGVNGKVVEYVKKNLW